MSNEIAHRTNDADQLAVQMRRAEAMAQAGDSLPRHYRNNPAGLLVAFEYADALGIPRVNALTSIHIIDGKPTASADLIGALVRKAGHTMRVAGDDTYAEVTIIRADDPDYVPAPVRWDEDKARKAGRWGNKGPWTQYPAAMLRARAITEAARMWASDALFGVIYTAEEIGADGPQAAPRHVESTQVTSQLQPETAVKASRIPDNMAERIDALDDPDKLGAMADWLAQVRDDDPATADAMIARAAERIDALAEKALADVGAVQEPLDVQEGTE